jgi:hypothetical protein
MIVVKTGKAERKPMGFPLSMACIRDIRYHTSCLGRLGVFIVIAAHRSGVELHS